MCSTCRFFYDNSYSIITPLIGNEMLNSPAQSRFSLSFRFRFSLFISLLVPGKTPFTSHCDGHDDNHADSDKNKVCRHLIDLHFSEGVVDLGGGELDTEGHEGVPESITIIILMIKMMMMNFHLQPCRYKKIN